ncbi:copper homeostasis protein CutC [Georgenia alba]|uniref:PF03932 family protein CutC n=1 Tax=Georgenia alba TaxID=2233858 RepID=A0ABW2QHL1_9MICO
MTAMLLEIAVQDAEGARVAREGGADRLELCQALDVGGLTPSVGVTELVTALGVPVRALVRARAGGFVHTATEVSAMVRDIEALLDAGVAGVVVGALTEDGLDRSTLRTLVRAAEGRPVVAHRCVDVLLGPWQADPAGLVEELLDCGVSGVLTSGGAPRALEGVPVIEALAAAADGRLEIVAGGGVRAEHVVALVDAGADAVHLSAGGPASAGPSGPGGGADVYTTTDPGLVAAARSAVAELSPSGGQRGA